jgi:hypothetical protein
MRGGPDWGALRWTAVTMVSTLVSYGSALLIEHAARLRVDVVILAVVMALTLGRTQRSADPLDCGVGAVLLPVVALGANEVGVLMTGAHVVVGDALFVVTVSAAIWIRRWGPRFVKAGTLVTVPLLASLVVAAPSTGGAYSLGTALVAVSTFGWVSGTQALARWVGLTGSRVLVGPGPGVSAGATAAVSLPGTARAGRLRASSRMAVQMGVALALAFAVGHALLHTHWSWTVLTAYIVCSGNRGRGDVVHKSVLRVAGASLGTIVATAVGGMFAPLAAAQVVAIFVVLGIGTWLRAVSYAYWAGCTTAAMALLYSYFGQNGSNLLLIRLGGIALGGTIGIAASWCVLPIRTGDVARRRTVDALTALANALGALHRDPGELDHHRSRFEDAVWQINRIAAPLEFHEFLTRKWRTGPHHADLFDALRRCVTPLRVVTQEATAHPTTPSVPEITELSTAVLADVVALRRSVADSARHQQLPADARSTSDAESRESPTPYQREAPIMKLNDQMSSLAALIRAIKCSGIE